MIDLTHDSKATEAEQCHSEVEKRADDEGWKDDTRDRCVDLDKEER